MVGGGEHTARKEFNFLLPKQSTTHCNTAEHATTRDNTLKHSLLCAPEFNFVLPEQSAGIFEYPSYLCVCVCACACVRESKRESARARERESGVVEVFLVHSVCVRERVCV